MSGVPKPRRTARLAKSLDKQLNLYTLAAKANCPVTYAAAVGVAGAAVMSLAPIAEAKIIYTPAHVQIRPNSYFRFDFDYLPKGLDDDFTLWRGNGCTSQGCGSGVGAGGYNGGHRSNPNALAATALGFYAVALRPGERMGPGKRAIASVEMAHDGHPNTTNHRIFWYGQWANGGRGLKNGYLGLKFLLNGKVHYGWARVSVTVKNNWFASETLTGYAFETIPNKSIIIGKTQGPDVIVEPATLGHLAAGANARSPWHIRGTAPDGETDVSPNGH
jgi:hypothetical protein